MKPTKPDGLKWLRFRNGLIWTHLNWASERDSESGKQRRVWEWVAIVHGGLWRFRNLWTALFNRPAVCVYIGQLQCNTEGPSAVPEEPSTLLTPVFYSDSYFLDTSDKMYTVSWFIIIQFLSCLPEKKGEKFWMVEIVNDWLEYWIERRRLKVRVRMRVEGVYLKENLHRAGCDKMIWKKMCFRQVPHLPLRPSHIHPCHLLYTSIVESMYRGGGGVGGRGDIDFMFLVPPSQGKNPDFLQGKDQVSFCWHRAGSLAQW